MPHHVAVWVPARGESVYADYRQPIVSVMRRCLAARMDGKDPAPADLELIAEWAELRPEEACTAQAPLFEGDCPSHGPAEPGPFTPPKYVRPAQKEALW